MTQPFVVKYVFILYVLIWNAFTVCIHSQAVLTTDKRCYAKNEAIRMSWNYRSRYTDTGNRNDDVIDIYYDSTIPTFENQGTESQMFVYVSTLGGATVGANFMIRNSGSVVFDGNPPYEGKVQVWPLKEGYYKSYLLDSRSGTIYTSSEVFAVGASACILTTDKRCYAKNEAIQMSWNYRSRYTNTGNRNDDVIAIYYDNTIPTLENLGIETQMFVYVSTLDGITSTTNTMIRNSGSVVFDGNPPNETKVQTWPLNVGYYKSYLFDSSTGSIYTSSDAFVVGACIHTNKTTYEYNEPISVYWNYLSSYTTPIIPGIYLPNYDYVAIFNSNDETNLNITRMFLAVSTLTETNDSTIRNNGVVIFDGSSPNKTGLQKWPLQAGQYAVRIFDLPKKLTYVSSDTFTVLAPSKTPTAAPTTTPTKTPSKTPTTAPTNAPTKMPSKTPTTAPTNAPTKIPSKSPTTAPTKARTKIPSKTPTTAPTNAPTKIPSKTPTNAPTKTPSKSPSKKPTTAPTKASTKSLTLAPTKAPTIASTKGPSIAPIIAPTTSPDRGRTCGLLGLGLFCPLTFCGFFSRLILGNRNC